MITKKDLLDAISECQNVRSPTANTAVKLAAFYTILDHMEDDTVQDTMSENVPEMRMYSHENVPEGVIGYNSDSDLSRAINGKKQALVWPVLDELMDTVKIINSRLYRGVLKKLENL